MENQISENMPVLAPPGAGLPAVELFIARLLFRWSLARSNRRQADANFERAKMQILELAGRVNGETGARRVLIKRLQGMEDSSRFWSVFMTLDHLKITNIGFGETVQSLGRGIVPSRVASTASVKPNPQADAGVVEDFKRSCDHFQRCSKEVADLKTSVRYTHPWFGPLDAAGWHFLTGFHMALHKRQIERILGGLSSVAQ